MDWDALFGILFATTLNFRKNDDIIHRHGIRVAETTMLPHIDEAGVAIETADLELIDVVLFVVGVDRARALSQRAALLDLLRRYPHELNGASYIDVGKEIGGDAAALQLFALGSVLGLWQLVTPASQAVNDTEALALASSGMVRITGYTAA